MRKSFIIHIDSLGVLDDLSDDQCGELFRAIKAHQLGGSIDLSPIVKIAFNPFKNQFDRDDIKYKKTCIARADAGSKGGKQKVANASKRKQTVANLADSDSKSDSKNKSDKDKTLDQSEIDREMSELMFNKFWESGIRKVNKKKAKSLFNNLFKKQEYGATFAHQLIDDVKKRLNSNQLGFAEMHPTTYLNGERWNDEVISNENNQGLNQAGRPSLVDRVEHRNAEREQRRQAQAGEGMGQAMETINGDLRPQASQPVRGDNTGGVGEVINGDYSRADS